MSNGQSGYHHISIVGGYTALDLKNVDYRAKCDECLLCSRILSGSLFVPGNKKSLKARLEIRNLKRFDYI
jgi:hypothetical protein